MSLANFIAIICTSRGSRDSRVLAFAAHGSGPRFCSQHQLWAKQFTTVCSSSFTFCFLAFTNTRHAHGTHTYMQTVFTDQINLKILKLFYPYQMVFKMLNDSCWKYPWFIEIHLPILLLQYLSKEDVFLFNYLSTTTSLLFHVIYGLPKVQPEKWLKVLAEQVWEPQF